MLRIASLCALLSLCGGVHAESDAYNRVDFQVESSREVANDLLIASMNAEIQGRQPAHVAQQLNATINEALKRSATFDSIRISSGNQNTYPIYDQNNHVDGGRAEIRLESRDFNVHLSINNGGGLPMLSPKAMMRTAMAIDAAAPAPEFAAGDSRMTVQISGLIELR